MKRRIFRTVLAGFVLVVAVVAGANAVVIMGSASSVRERGDTISQVDDYQAVMVLGAMVWDDKPSHMLEDRLQVGLEIYESGAVPKLLLSGDHYRARYNEVQVMKNYMVENGVASEDIFMDHAGLSTYESMIRAKRVFGIDRMVIVTQRFHLNRALWLAERVGIEAVGVPADLRIYSTIRHSQIREVAARVKDFFVGLTLPDSYIDGEPIDITGDGNVTQD